MFRLIMSHSTNFSLIRSLGNQTLKPLNSQESVDFVTVLVVNIARRPIFLNPPFRLSKREEADIQCANGFLSSLMSL